MTVDRDADLDSLRTSCLSFISTGSAESTETLVLDADDPPPYSSIDQSQPWNAHYHSSPPTSPSLNSLHPTDSSASNDDRRKLLLIYIHGFMGNETSFQGFPADVHNLLAALLSQTHSVHTKIYPRYRSKKAISVATHDFSQWLTPHESSITDVVLLGHSLGGILAAEVALLSPENPSSVKPLRHNILGTLSFDTPFLGMHPGVIRSGLGSIFSPSPVPDSQPRESHNSDNTTGLEPLSAIVGVANILFGSSRPDPNYNPAFPNDVRLPVRSGWANAVHFVQKHSNDLRHATKQLVTSHLEFGGCLADMDGLKARYTRIRLLEEETEALRKTVVQGAPPRIRFANYYTASTGRIKAEKLKSPQASTSDLGNRDESMLRENDQKTTTVISEDETEEQETLLRDSEDDMVSENELRDVEPIAEIDSDLEEEIDIATPDTSLSSTTSASSTLASISVTGLDIPGLPNRPTVPTLPADDRAACVRMLLDYSRDLKNYRQALKTYRKTHCDIIKENRKTHKMESKLCPKSMLDQKKLGQGRSNLDLVNLGSDTMRRDSDSISEVSTLNTEAERQHQLQVNLESQERNVEVCEQKITRMLEKAERKSEKSLHKHARKVEDAERKMTREVDKAVRKAEKDREKAERKVAKESEKAEKKIAKEMEKSGKKTCKGAEKRTKRTGSCQGSESASDLTSITPTTSSKTLPVEEQSSNLSSRGKKTKKDKKFCLLPPKDSKGNRDPCWVRVYMQGVDEVGAHCGLFFPWQPGEMGEGQDGSHGSSERYAGLVSSVAEKVEEWVLESATARALSEG